MTQSTKNRWIFDLNRLQNTPSKRDGIGAHEELFLRQKGTSLIREMAKELKLRPICMNTAFVYFHRFFALRSFKRFDVNRMSVCSLFLAAKFEEQHIFKDHIIKLWFHCQQIPITDELYKKESEKLVENENEMLLTFGFDLSVIHFQTVICTASDPNVITYDIQRSAYLIASELLRLTTICLQFSPKFGACLCIYLSSTLLDLPITTNWVQSIDPNANISEVEREAQKFKSFVNVSKLLVEEKKRKEMSSSPESAYSSSSGNSPLFDDRPKSNAISSENFKSIKKSNHSFGQNVANHKRIKTESNTRLNISTINLKSKTNSLTNSTKTKVLPNKSVIKKEIKDSNHLTLNNCQKVVKQNGEFIRVVPPNSCAKAVQMKSSSTVKQNTQTTEMNGNTISLNQKLKNINFKITFSTDEDSMKSNNNNKRIVETIVQNSKQILKVVES